MIAALLGAGPLADAFFVAFKLPNFLRRLFAEGAFNAGFVPLFARTLEGEGRAAAKAFAEQAQAIQLAVLAPLVLLTIVAMPWVIVVMAPGFEPGRRALRGRGRAVPDHLRLHPVHRAGRALWRRAQLARPLRRRRRGADPAQSLPDRRADPERALARCSGPCARLGGRRRRAAAGPVAAPRRPARGHGAGALPAAAQPADQAPVRADPARRDRRRRRPDQSVHRRRARLAAAAGRGVVPVFRRPGEPAAARGDRRRGRHRAVAADGAPAARRPGRACDAQPEPRARAGPAPDRARGGRARWCCAGRS